MLSTESKTSGDEPQNELAEDDRRIPIAAVPYSAMQFPLSGGPEGWKRRPRSPGLRWYKQYDTPESLKKGRVLLIDYVKEGRS